MMENYNLKHFDYRALQDMDVSQKNELAKEIRKNIIKVVSSNGGHLSSNLGVVELTIALCSQFNPFEDDILFDVGHQTYTYKILTGRNIETLRKKDGISGFQDLEESAADKMSAGHSSTSISIGLGMATAKKLTNDNSRTVIVIGDASFSNGLSLEALNAIDEKEQKPVIIILNDNGMAISRDRGNLSRCFKNIRTSSFYQFGAGRFKTIFDRRGLRWIYNLGRHFKNTVRALAFTPSFFDSLNCEYLGPIDGHDIHKLENFMERAKFINKSVIIHIKTKKGKGYQLAEEDKDGYWHGASPFEVESGEPIRKHPDIISLSHLAGDAILQKLNDDPKAVLVSAAMVKGAHLEEAFAKFPQRCFDVGISEEHGIDLVAGLALKGMHPILSLYSTFAQRGYDEFLHDLCRMKLSVLVVLDRVGLVGADGASHHGIFDVSMLGGMPNTSIYQPFEGKMLIKQILDYKFDTNGPQIIRAERSYVDIGESNLSQQYQTVDYEYLPKANSKVLFVAVGIPGKESFDKLKGKMNCLMLNKLMPLPSDLDKIFKKQEKIIFYDSTSVESGLASFISLHLNKIGYKGTFVSYALPVKFIDSASKGEQLKEVGLDEMTVVKKILNTL